MTIEVALVISGVSLAFGLYSGIANMKRKRWRAEVEGLLS